VNDRDHLDSFLSAIDASPTALERPVRRGWIGDYQITGKRGHVLAAQPGYLLYANTPERDEPHPDRQDRKLCYGSTRKWTNIKAQLAFAKLTQDGDDEGCFYLDRLPTQAEASRIRKALGIRRRRHLSPEVATAAALNLRRVKSIDKAPSIAPNGETDAEVETEPRED